MQRMERKSCDKRLLPGQVRLRSEDGCVVVQSDTDIRPSEDSPGASTRCQSFTIKQDLLVRRLEFSEDTIGDWKDYRYDTYISRPERTRQYVRACTDLEDRQVSIDLEEPAKLNANDDVGICATNIQGSLERRDCRHRDEGGLLVPIGQHARPCRMSWDVVRYMLCFASRWQERVTNSTNTH
jgi:hypothetical protein